MVCLNNAAKGGIKSLLRDVFRRHAALRQPRNAIQCKICAICAIPIAIGMCSQKSAPISALVRVICVP